MLDYKISPGTAGNSDIPERYEDLPSHNIEVFQSENIQNILDAKSKTKSSVEIHYEIKKLDKTQRENLKSLLGKQFFDMLFKSFEESESQDIEEQVEKVKLALENEDKWFALLITEKNTIGLIGDETGEEKGSKYHALMRHINKSVKDDVSGGTFGKGSSVYTYCSGLWLWFAYSILENSWNGTKARFIGRGMIAPFIDRQDVQSFSGPLWYSRPELADKKEQGLPFINDDAHMEAKKFGIPQRSEKDIGTTYLIPVFWPEDIDIKKLNAETLARELKHEIIKKWFIPIYNEQLKCFIKVSGEEDNRIIITKNELNEVPDLKYKLEILQWYNADVNKENKKFRLKQIKIDLPILNKAQQKKVELQYGKKIGNKRNISHADLVVRILNEDEKYFTGFLEKEEISTVNRIALTRNKGMIINHYPYQTKYEGELKSLIGENNFEAILFAGKMSKSKQSEEIINHTELFLSYAENPAHNEWIHDPTDKNRCHLKRFEESPSPFNRIKNIFTQLYNAIAEIFPKDDKPPAKNDICSFWRKLYKLPSAGSEKSGISNFSYDTLDEGFDKEGRYTWKLKVFSTNPEKQVKLQFNHYLNSLEGPIKTEAEFVNLGISEFKELMVKENGNNILELLLDYDLLEDRGVPKEIEIKTCCITGNNLFKNMNPILEIIDSVISN